MPVFHLKESDVLNNNPKHQGKFHLLVIFGIPVLLILLFLIQSILWSITFILLLLIVILLLFRKRR